MNSPQSKDSKAKPTPVGPQTILNSPNTFPDFEPKLVSPNDNLNTLGSADESLFLGSSPQKMPNIIVDK